MGDQYQSHAVLLAAATEDEETYLILVVGESQSGKTKLVNLLSRSNLPTGHGEASCTHHLQLSKPFEHERRKVILIDTPGLEHSHREEEVIFRELVLFLVDLYKAGKHLHGIIFVQSIMDHWKSATAVRSITLINKMCGDDVMKNLIIASTMHPGLSDEGRAKREAQMCNGEWSLKPFIDAGATFISHKNLESARQILVHILDQQPVPLLVQTEMHEAKKKFHETRLGSALAFGTKDEVLYNHEKYMKELITDMSKLRMDLTSHYLGWNAGGYPGHYNYQHGRPVPRIGGPAHSLVCAICGEGIYGVRYKCLQCPNYDACSNCYYYIPEMHPVHSFIRLNGLDVAANRNQPFSYAPVRQIAYNQSVPPNPSFIPGSRASGLHHSCAACDTSASLI